MSEPSDDRLVMFRDASFWRSPGCAVRYHLPRDDERGHFGHRLAQCDRRIQLDESNACTVHQADALMCRRCARTAK